MIIIIIIINIIIIIIIINVIIIISSYIKHFLSLFPLMVSLVYYFDDFPHSISALFFHLMHQPFFH